MLDEVWVYEREGMAVSGGLRGFARACFPSADLVAFADMQRGYLRLRELLGALAADVPRAVLVPSPEALGASADDVRRAMRKLAESGAVVLVDSYPHCRELVEPAENAAALWAVVDVLEGSRGGAAAAAQRPGPKPIDFPEGWEGLFALWEAGQITAREFMARTGLKRGTFYHLVSEYRCFRESADRNANGVA